jgi:hypothetical protein
MSSQISVDFTNADCKRIVPNRKTGDGAEKRPDELRVVPKDNKDGDALSKQLADVLRDGEPVTRKGRTQTTSYRVIRKAKGAFYLATEHGGRRRL